ncbi:MAG: hypothetical protein HYX67_16025 [Candidatus Melainabacteria bacterium]|nr:hypothetical protein [Candidatus Melainabacteria bacterium]
MISSFGLAFDQRLISGEHAWIKPVKFSASLTMYGLTLYWLSQFLTSHEQSFRKMSQAALVGTVAELSIIILQAIRGASNHINAGTPFDHALAWIAAVAILPVAFGTVAIFIMLLRERSLPPVLGAALKWGVFLSIAGCIPGVLMLLPAAVQDLITHSRQIYGHAAGIPQVGPGLPFLGWSTVSGDLRVAHFVGIHALQFFPVAAFFLMKLLPKLSTLRQELLIGNMGATYLATIILLTRQALIAEPLTAPSHHTLAYAVLLTLISLNAAVYILLAPPLAVPTQWQEAES